MAYITTVSISEEFNILRKKYKISVSEAFRVGMAVILSDLGEPQFATELNIMRKLKGYQSMVEELNKEIIELTKKEKGGKKK